MNQQQSMQFQQMAASMVADVSERTKVVACAVAVALSRSQPLPTSPVQDASMHYVNMVAPPLRYKLSSFNEGVVFDIRMAQEVMRQLWLLRYSACFGAKVQMYKPENSFIENFTGASAVISTDIMEVLDKNQTAIGLLGAQVTNILAEEQEAVQ